MLCKRSFKITRSDIISYVENIFRLLMNCKYRIKKKIKFFFADREVLGKYFFLQIKNSANCFIITKICFIILTLISIKNPIHSYHVCRSRSSGTGRFYCGIQICHDYSLFRRRIHLVWMILIGMSINKYQEMPRNLILKRKLWKLRFDNLNNMSWDDCKLFLSW